MESLRDRANRERAEMEESRRKSEEQRAEWRRLTAERLAEILSILKDFSPPNVPLADLSLSGGGSEAGTFLNRKTDRYEALRFGDYRDDTFRYQGPAYSREQLPISTMAWLALRASSDGWGGKDGILIAENETDIYRFETYSSRGQHCNGVQYSLLDIRPESSPDIMFYDEKPGGVYYAVGSDLRERGII